LRNEVGKEKKRVLTKRRANTITSTDPYLGRKRKRPKNRKN